MVPAAAAIPSSLFPGFSSKHSQDSHLSPDSLSVLRGKHSLRGHGSGTPFPLVPADLESHRTICIPDPTCQLSHPLPLDFAQRNARGAASQKNPKEKPLPNLTEKGFKALQNTDSCSCLIRPHQFCPIHLSCAGEAKAPLAPLESLSETTDVHPGQHLETTPGGNRKENYRKSRGPYLDGFPKDSAALYALCALYKNGLLLRNI
ncbi:uncharacterized protein M8220_007909 [Acridotheres tristis]